MDLAISSDQPWLIHWLSSTSGQFKGVSIIHKANILFTFVVNSLGGEEPPFSQSNTKEASLKIFDMYLILLITNHYLTHREKRNHVQIKFDWTDKVASELRGLTLKDIYLNVFSLLKIYEVVYVQQPLLMTRFGDFVVHVKLSQTCPAQNLSFCNMYPPKPNKCV